MRKYVVELTEKNGATSPVDNVIAADDYTAEQYVNDCIENADSDWIDMLLNAVKIELIPCDD